MSRSSAPLQWHFWLLIGGVLVLHVCSGIFIYNSLDSWPERGQFGNMFGPANALFSGLALAAVLYAVFQLRVMEQQLNDSRQWNRMSFTFTQLRMAEVLSPIEKKLNENWVKLIDRTTPLGEADVDKLFSVEEVETRALLRTYVNEMERFAAAVNLGLADDQLAKRLYRHNLTRHFIELKPYIDRLRDLQNAPGILKELENLVERWKLPLTATPAYGQSASPSSTD